MPLFRDISLHSDIQTERALRDWHVSCVSSSSRLPLFRGVWEKLHLQIPSKIKGRGLNSPKPVLLLLPQVEVPLDHVPNVLGLLVRELGEVQLLARAAARHHGGAAGGAGLLGGSGAGGRSRVQPDYITLRTKKEGLHTHSGTRGPIYKYHI